ncbi:MAG: hypothetical protein SCARUB_00758 [Candidatus Scalindua rubra]|uniref:Outer membrane protein beta-barrel domain-containing protein n=1 Tax=Candidatus Scalindua rubra TaxID=1872076 RepID=A0A1E3XEM9_9BACT|nr:MAG: hypothetical protein SCARUB_00758 [Candidatus Scalindua rubra]
MICFMPACTIKDFRTIMMIAGVSIRTLSRLFFVIPEEPGTDRKNLLVELGLTLPDIPIFTFSYEKKMRDGDISSLTWGQATEGVSRKIVPTIKEVNDDVNIIRVGAKYKHDIANIEVEQRWEFTDLETVRTEKNFTNGLPNTNDARVVDEKDTFYESSQTTVKIDKRINKKLSLSGGYRYTKVDNDSEQRVQTFTPAGAVSLSGGNRNWFDPNSDSDVISHLWNLNLLAKPLKDLTVQGFFRLKNIHRDSVSTWSDNRTTGVQEHDITARTNNTTFGEAIRITYKRIPRIAPYFEAGWQQGDIEIKEKESLSGFFQRDTDRDYDKQTYTMGLSFYPFKRVSGSIQYRKELKKNEYDDELDTESATGIVPGGFPAFIDKQYIDTDVYTTRLTAHPISSVSTTFRYEYRAQEIDSKMEGLGRELAHVDIQTFSGSVTITPFSNLFITSMVMHQNLRVKTRARNDQAAPTRPFEGDSTTFVNTAIFALNEKTEFSADYQASLTDNYDENNINDLGLPLEHDYTMQALTLGAKYKIRKNMTLWSRYSLYDYDESHIADIDDYTEHLFAIGGEIRFR